jgi:hypothetical protein
MKKKADIYSVIRDQIYALSKLPANKRDAKNKEQRRMINEQRTNKSTGHCRR